MGLVVGPQFVFGSVMSWMLFHVGTWRWRWRTGCSVAGELNVFGACARCTQSVEHWLEMAGWKLDIKLRVLVNLKLLNGFSPQGRWIRCGHGWFFLCSLCGTCWLSVLMGDGVGPQFACQLEQHLAVSSVGAVASPNELRSMTRL